MKTFRQLSFSAVSVMVLTLVHHGYGAIIYAAPFRLHVAFLAIPVILVLVLTFRTYRKFSSAVSGKIALWVCMTVTLLVPVGVIGFFEGGYNHLVKNMLFYGGASRELLVSLFPPPAYEMPGDFWFEATGIGQFLAGMYCLYRFVQFSAGRKGSGG